MSVAGSGGGDGIQLVDIVRLDGDNLALASGGDQQNLQMEKNTSRGARYMHVASYQVYLISGESSC